MIGGRPALRDWVALVLATGLAVSLIIIVGAVLYDAIQSQVAGLSENATQIITGAFGGILGVLGSYLGFQAGARQRDDLDAVEDRRDADPPTSSGADPDAT